MRKAIVAILILATATAFYFIGCKKDIPSDYVFTDLSQIVALLQTDPVGLTAYPPVWIDTTEHTFGAGKAPTEASLINPADYWVEVLRQADTIKVLDSCKADEFNTGDTCSIITLADGRRAKTKIAQIFDSLKCRYHIIDYNGSEYTKDVTYYDVLYALMAKLNSDNLPFRGWALYACGRMRHGVSYTGSGFAKIDSVVLTSPGKARYVTFPQATNVRYTPTAVLPVYSRGDDITIQVFTHEQETGSNITDAYIQYLSNGQTTHEWMGSPIPGTREGYTYFQTTISEQSARTSGLFSQIVIELFVQPSLRDSSPTAFRNLIWGITYKVGF